MCPFPGTWHCHESRVGPSVGIRGDGIEGNPIFFFKYFIFVTTSELKIFHKYQPLAAPSRAFPIKNVYKTDVWPG